MLLLLEKLISFQFQMLLLMKCVKSCSLIGLPIRKLMLLRLLMESRFSVFLGLLHCVRMER